MVYKSLSIWTQIKKFYDTILDHTSWTIGIGTFINLWNDKWYSTTSLANIAGLSDGASISRYSLSNIPLSLQQMHHFFNHIMVREEQDITNWIQMNLFVSHLNRLGLFSWNQEFHVVGVNSFGLHIFRLPKL